MLVGNQYFTLTIGSDRYPYELVEQLTDTRVKVRAMTMKLIEGSALSEHQVYELESDASNPTLTVSLRKNDNYIEVGRPLNSPSQFYRGIASAYLDPSF